MKLWTEYRLHITVLIFFLLKNVSLIKYMQYFVAKISHVTTERCVIPHDVGT